MTEPRGRIFLVARAPVDITYEHTIDFKDANEQNAFWRSLSKYDLSNYSYVRRERQYINVHLAYEQLDGINYLFFQSREDTGSKWYYAFVTERKYVGDDLTTLYFELDVLQSFMFDYEWKPSYVAQSHVDRWNAEHKPIYSYTDEGLDYGTEYLTEAAFRIKPVKYRNQVYAPHDHGFYLVFCTNHSELISSGDASEPSIANLSPTPYCIYLLHDLPTETRVYLHYGNSDKLQMFMAGGIKQFNDFMANSALGNFVHQIVYVPYLPYKYTIADILQGSFDIMFTDEDGEDTFAQTTLKSDTRTLNLIKINDVGDKLSTFIKDLATMPIFSGIEECVPNEKMWEALKANPHTTERDRRFESKLLCYPYRYNLFTDWKNQSVIIKNEFLSGDKITVAQVFSYGFNVNRRYFVKNYRRDLEGREASINDTIPIESPVFSDAYYSYMLQNKNQISANLTNTKINAAHGVAMGIANGASSGRGLLGSIVGGVAGGVSAGIQGGLDIQSTIRSENAKQSDISAQPDTFSETSDPIMARIDRTAFLSFYRKGICCNFAEQLAQYWHMYGYIVRRMEIPNLRSRLRFNFIKTIGANLEGNIESTHMATLKNIFNKGVTIWHYSAEDFKPLDYTYENPERSLI